MEDERFREELIAYEKKKLLSEHLPFVKSFLPPRLLKETENSPSAHSSGTTVGAGLGPGYGTVSGIVEESNFNTPIGSSKGFSRRDSYPNTTSNSNSASDYNSFASHFMGKATSNSSPHIGAWNIIHNRPLSDD